MMVSHRVEGQAGCSFESSDRYLSSSTVETDASLWRSASERAGRNQSSGHERGARRPDFIAILNVRCPAATWSDLVRHRLQRRMTVGAIPFKETTMANPGNDESH